MQILSAFTAPRTLIIHTVHVVSFTVPAAYTKNKALVDAQIGKLHAKLDPIM